MARDVGPLKRYVIIFDLLYNCFGVAVIVLGIIGVINFVREVYKIFEASDIIIEIDDPIAGEFVWNGIFFLALGGCAVFYFIFAFIGAWKHNLCILKFTATLLIISSVIQLIFGGYFIGSINDVDYRKELHDNLMELAKNNSRHIYNDNNYTSNSYMRKQFQDLVNLQKYKESEYAFKYITNKYYCCKEDDCIEKYDYNKYMELVRCSEEAISKANDACCIYAGTISIVGAFLNIVVSALAICLLRPIKESRRPMQYT